MIFVKVYNPKSVALSQAVTISTTLAYAANGRSCSSLSVIGRQLKLDHQFDQLGHNIGYSFCETPYPEKTD